MHIKIELTGLVIFFAVAMQVLPQAAPVSKPVIEELSLAR
jgi:hypothetical protein